MLTETIEVSLLNVPPYVQIIVHYIMYKNEY